MSDTLTIAPLTYRTEWAATAMCSYRRNGTVCWERSAIRQERGTNPQRRDGKPMCGLCALAELVTIRECVRHVEEVTADMDHQAREHIATPELARLLDANKAAANSLATTLRQVPALREVTRPQVEALLALAPTWAGTFTELVEATTLLSR